LSAMLSAFNTTALWAGKIKSNQLSMHILKRIIK
jgi:hypothetical protein